MIAMHIIDPSTGIDPALIGGMNLEILYNRLDIESFNHNGTLEDRIITIVMNYVAGFMDR